MATKVKGERGVKEKGNCLSRKNKNLMDFLS